MKKVFLAVIAVIVVLAGGLMLSYNGLAGSKEAVETAEADVDTMLQRRADLIPNLVSTVKSYTKHETGVVDRVLEARDQLMNADTVEEIRTRQLVPAGKRGLWMLSIKLSWRSCRSG